MQDRKAGTCFFAFFLFSQYGAVHQQRQFQYAAERLLPAGLFPNHRALPAGILPEQYPDGKRGLLSPPPFQHRLRRLFRSRRRSERPFGGERLRQLHLIQQSLHLFQKIHQAFERFSFTPIGIIQSAGGLSSLPAVHAYQCSPVLISIFSVWRLLCSPPFPNYEMSIT